MKYVVALFVAMFAFVSPVQAQQVKVATGSAKGTYSTMFKEILTTARCGDIVNLVEVPSTGSIESVNKLLGNEVSAAFTQMDVLFFRNQTEDLSKVKTLVALAPEEVHFVAKSALKIGSKMGFGGHIVNSVTDLMGQNIGAAGGSFVTAKVIQLVGQLPYNVIQFENNDAVLAAIAKGDIAAGVFVGGQPLAYLNALGPDFKVLTVPPELVDRLKSVYRPARVTYNKMGATGIATVSTDALFVTREYKTPAMLENLGKLRKCILEAVPELQDTTGTHPKWQAVDPANKGKWAWYELPDAPPPPPARKK